MKKNAPSLLLMIIVLSIVPPNIVSPVSADLYSEDHWWIIDYWHSGTFPPHTTVRYMSGEFIAVDNTFEGLTDDGLGGIFWEDTIFYLPINVAYGTSGTNCIWFQFAVTFTPENLKSPEITWHIWEVEGHETSDIPLIGKIIDNLHYKRHAIGLDYVVGHKYWFALLAGPPPTFVIKDETTGATWSRDDWDFTVPSTGMFVDYSFFSPASCVEGYTSSSSLSGTPFFKTKLGAGITQHYGDRAGPIPQGVDTYQKSLDDDEHWYWMMLTPGSLPQPKIGSVDYPSSIVLGESATIDVTAANEGVANNVDSTAAWQTLSVSFPEGQSISSVSVVESDLSNAQVYNPGTTVNAAYGATTVGLKNYLVEGSAYWPEYVSHHLKLRVKPANEGSFIFYVKSVASATGYFATNWDPDTPISNVEKDQQHEFAYKYTISVRDDDTTPPSYSNPTTSPSGTVYDSHSGSVRLKIDWEDSSGIYEVKFKYKYGSGSFTSWRSPTSSSGKTYWYDIPGSDWISHIDKTIYWESYATDNDDTRETQYTPTFTGPSLKDDDTSGPSFSNPTSTGDIYEDYTESYRIGITVTDSSGVYIVKFSYRFDGSWSSWHLPSDSSGSRYWYDIPKNEWSKHVPSTVYYKVYAEDDDKDRSNDRESATSQEYTAGNIFEKGNEAPTAVIDDINPSPAVQGDTVYFSGHGTDPDGDSIVEYGWRSSIDGSLSSSSSFSTSSLSVGTHTIYFKVKDSRGAWSTEATRTLTINPKGNEAPTAVIDDINPSPAVQGQTVYFSGHGTDSDGSIVEYSWESSIDGFVSSSSSFSTSSLSVGTHTISFKVKDDDGAWSTADTETLTIQGAFTCNVRVDRSDGVYYVGDPVVIYYSVSETCDGTLTIYTPDRTLQYDFYGISPGVEHSFSGTAGYPIGRRDVAFDIWKGSQSASASCVFYVYEHGENHPPVLTDGQADPSTGYPDTTFTFWVRYYDQDNDPAVMKRIYVYSNGWYSFDMYHYSGDPLSGEWFYIQLYESEGWSPGSHNFYFQFSDGQFEVREPTSGYLTFTIGSVDLVISDVSWSPSSLKEGDTVTFTVTIKNQGTLDAGYFKTAYYIDGVKKGEWSMSSLSSGQTTSKAFTWTSVEGSHTVKAFADSSYNIRESDENNNRREESFSVSGQPDLIVSDVSWSPSSLKEGDTVTFTTKIKNQGTESASSFKTAYYIDGVKKGEWSMSSLNAGQTVTKTFTWIAVEGSHTVRVYSDSNYNIQEKDENNNQREESFTVSGKPDLKVSDITWSPATPVEDERVTFTVTIENQGTVRAGSFKVTYHIDGVKLGEWDIYGLSASQTTTKTFTWTSVEGSHTVKAFADSSYNVDEKEETNNERQETIKVAPKPKPDPIISSITWSPSSPVGSDTVTFTVPIKNQGGADAGRFKVAYYIDGTQKGEWTIYSLSAGQTTSKTFTWTAVEGSHTVKVVADSNNDIVEENEANNDREEPFQVDPKPKPDLLISDISWSPASPVEGDAVTFTVTIKNQGNASTGSFEVAYYIDDVKKGELSMTSFSAGQTTTKTFTWTAVEGTHIVKVYADSYEGITEEDEANNEREETFEVGPKPKPDLVISSIGWSPASPVEDNTVTFTVVVENQGGADAGRFKVAYYIDGTQKGEWTIYSLSAGQTTSKTFTWTAVEGSHTVKVVADSNNDIVEENEANNEREEVVGNLPPVASFCCNNGYNYLNNSVVFMCESTCFNASGSHDPDGSIVSYTWEFGDGNVTTVTNPIVRHNYTTVGAYNITLVVTDDQGSQSTTTGDVEVILLGDLDDNGKVNIIDISIVALAFGTQPGDKNWNSTVDMDNNDIINIVDISIVAMHFGEEM